MRRLCIAVLVLAAMAGAETLRHFHIHQIDYTSFKVSCDNGGDPTGRKEGNDLVISCGK